MRKLTVLGMAMAAVLLLSACTSSGGGLTGKAWQLTAVTETVPAFQGVVPEADQSRYTITFNTDGTYNATADCNSLSGTYTTTGTGGLSIELGPMTRVACPEGSMADTYVAALAAAERYAIADSQLTITTTNGSLSFK